jgi:hypothetical protein
MEERKLPPYPKISYSDSSVLLVAHTTGWVLKKLEEILHNLGVHYH